MGTFVGALLLMALAASSGVARDLPSDSFHITKHDATRKLLQEGAGSMTMARGRGYRGTPSDRSPGLSKSPVPPRPPRSPEVPRSPRSPDGDWSPRPTRSPGLSRSPDGDWSPGPRSPRPHKSPSPDETPTPTPTTTPSSGGV